MVCAPTQGATSPAVCALPGPGCIFNEKLIASSQRSAPEAAPGNVYVILEEFP